ncbi:MAG: hypothetical protein L0Y66_17010 [Myxococcaceae bacterium]|nr:hypothetical protein [Myxococcaceae bacterium]MCI0672309.1 hypothetical protein [Myxococcaceae bacterium]
MSRPLPRTAEPERLVQVWTRILERRLSARMKVRALVEIHDNTHTMVTYQRRGGVWRVRLHHMFLAASDEVVAALAAFIRTGDPVSSALLDRYIERNKVFIRRQSPAQLRKRLRIDPVGEHHDLEDIFRALNRRYFRSQAVTAAITYGPAPRVRKPRKSIKMGSYSADSQVIRIHPALDHPTVPRYFVEWIVFHEMLHHVYKARRREDGKRCLHPPEFMEHERRFHDYTRAHAWEQQNLERLLAFHIA